MRRSLGRISLVLVAAAVVCGALAAPASATTAAQFMDQSLFKPHNSPITGAMVVINGLVRHRHPAAIGHPHR